MNERLWQLADQHPFGNVASISGRTLQPYSFASLQGAENLLAKALRVLSTDRSRAVKYVASAVALPFDHHEEAFPAARAASMSLYSMVVDELGDCPEEDNLWLEAALAVLDQVRTDARFDLRDILAAIDQDYDLTDREHRLLQAAIKPIPKHPELTDQVDLSPDELRDRILDILDLEVAYLDALSTLAQEGA